MSSVGDFELRLKMLNAFHVEMNTIESTGYYHSPLKLEVCIMHLFPLQRNMYLTYLGTFSIFTCNFLLLCQNQFKSH